MLCWRQLAFLWRIGMTAPAGSSSAGAVSHSEENIEQYEIVIRNIAAVGVL